MILSRATHWSHIGLYIAISPPLGHHYSFIYTPIYTYLSPQPLQALTDLDVDLRDKSDSYSPHVADSELADCNGFGSETIYIYNCLVADYPDDNDNDNGVVDDAQLWLSVDCPGLASSGHRSVTH